MDDTFFVRRFQRFHDLMRDFQRFFYWNME
jgi:hypothetical protein